MKLMLDTHSFIWWATDPTKLSPRVLALCQDSTTDLILSVVSLWEIQIKAQLGKLVLTTPLPTLITSQVQINRIRILPVELPHVLQLDNLPLHHKDPFDRLLIAQAIYESASFASVDTLFALYPVVLLW
jgi:PIN domain nuclease of toxin-antitoxin system